MGGLVSIFRNKNAVFMQRKHQNTTQWQTTKTKRIEKFLRYCETKQVRDLHQIKQKHFNDFMTTLSETGKSPETVRKYSLVIKEFCSRAHLNIRINPAKAKKRKISKKIDKIVEVLKKNEISKEKIVKIVIEIKKIL